MVHYPLVRKIKPMLIWLIAYVLLMIASLFNPLLFLAVCFVSPVLLSVLGISSGILPMSIFALLLPGMAWLLSGTGTASALCAMYLWPFLIAHVFCFERRVSFWHSAAVHISVLAISQTAIMVILRSYVGGNLFLGGADYLVQAVSQSPRGNDLLLSLYQLNILRLPEGMVPAINLTIAQVMMPLARIELLNGLRTIMENYLPMLISTLMVYSAVIAGVFGVAFPIAAAKKMKIETIDMESFNKWHLSSGAGIIVFLLGLGNLLSSGLPNSSLSLAGMMMSEAFFIIFAIQGAALMDFFQTRTAAHSSTRWLWPVIVFFVMPWLLMILGIADQILNFRGLRKPKNREEI